MLCWMSIIFLSPLQFVIVVVDSTDRERISVTKEELYKMLAHEVSVAKTGCQRHGECPGICACTGVEATSSS